MNEDERPDGEEDVAGGEENERLADVRKLLASPDIASYGEIAARLSERAEGEK